MKMAGIDSFIPLFLNLKLDHSYFRFSLFNLYLVLFQDEN